MSDGSEYYRHPDCRSCDERMRVNVGLIAENKALKVKLSNGTGKVETGQPPQPTGGDDE